MMYKGRFLGSFDEVISELKDLDFSAHGKFDLDELIKHLKFFYNLEIKLGENRLIELEEEKSDELMRETEKAYDVGYADGHSDACAEMEKCSNAKN